MGKMKLLHEELSSMPYNDLLKLAKEKGVSTKGKKNEIVERLCGDGVTDLPFKIYVVNVGALNVRKEPSMQSEVLKIVFREEELKIFGEENGFLKLEEGFVKKEFLEVK